MIIYLREKWLIDFKAGVSAKQFFFVSIPLSGPDRATYFTFIFTKFTLRPLSHKQFWHPIFKYKDKDIMIILHFLAMSFY